MFIYLEKDYDNKPNTIIWDTLHGRHNPRTSERFESYVES